jgi:hypothetical protein
MVAVWFVYTAKILMIVIFEVYFSQNNYFLSVYSFELVAFHRFLGLRVGGDGQF